MKLKVYAALTEDANQGWVWISEIEIPHRSVVKISTDGCKKGMYCEALTVDENFMRAYNGRDTTKNLDAGPALIASEWYRKRLRLEKGQYAEIEVVAANGLIGRLWACWDHPQIVIHFAAVLGVWGFCFGAAGLILSIVGIALSIIQLMCSK